MNSQDKLFAGVEIVELLRSKWSKDTWLIAGGAVRDIILDKYINDIDIYTNHRLINNTCSYLIYYLNSTFNTDYYLSHSIISNQYISRKVLTIKYSNINIDIIFSNTPYNDINTFDLGICKTYLNINNKIIMLDDFIKDRDNKTITLYPSPLTSRQLVRSLTYHIPKLRKKYPDYELRIDYE